jgi:hypothetical protein
MAEPLGFAIVNRFSVRTGAGMEESATKRHKQRKQNSSISDDFLAFLSRLVCLLVALSFLQVRSRRRLDNFTAV